MEKIRIDTIGGPALLVGLLWSLSGVAGAATITVNCDAGDKIQVKLSSAKREPGDTLLVSGTCNENLVIAEEISRVTLDGQGKATINSQDQIPPVEVRGRGITIKGFTITGGRYGIRLSGSRAVIDGNTIRRARQGIAVAERSVGLIVNNTVENNENFGIEVGSSSFALIGILGTTDTAASPNIIRKNRSGVVVFRTSGARIVGNTISDNKGNGILVMRGSFAEIASNKIDGNSGSAISVTLNSAVLLGSDDGPGIFQSPNSSAVDNGEFGIKCSVGGAADGRLGTLRGVKAAKEFSEGCIDSLKP